MTIREAGKGIVRKSYGGRKNTYRIGFVNRDGEEDETELDAEDINYGVLFVRNLIAKQIVSHMWRLYNARTSHSRNRQ